MAPALALGFPAKQIKLASELLRSARIISTIRDLRDVSSCSAGVGQKIWKIWTPIAYIFYT